MFTVMLDLCNQPIVVIGGGNVATRRIKSFLKEGAEITVVAPSFTEEICKWSDEDKVRLKRKSVEKKDFEHAFLIVIATNDETVTSFVAKHARKNQLVNAASQFSEGNVQVPAQFSRGNLSISVSTNGASPSLTKKIKQELEQQFDESYIEYTYFLAHCREVIHNMNCSKEEKHQLLLEIINEKYRISTYAQQEFLQRIQS
ncbi:NAD(P)-binding protein [Priestia megaterium]|nr:NAD(P)-binding protein [Priestia megaterium]